MMPKLEAHRPRVCSNRTRILRRTNWGQLGSFIRYLASACRSIRIRVDREGRGRAGSYISTRKANVQWVHETNHEASTSIGITLSCACKLTG